MDALQPPDEHALSSTFIGGLWAWFCWDDESSGVLESLWERISIGVRRELYLPRKVVGRREVAFAVDEQAPENEYRIVRRRYLLHSLRHRSLPTRPGDEVLTRLRTGRARAYVCKVDVE